MKDIKVSVTFTEGYEDRFTEACLEVIKKRESEDIDPRSKVYKKKQNIADDVEIA